MDLPEPMTPVDADLQDFPFMPLQVARLRDSDLAAEEDPQACWYAVLLWAASWHQIPAGSLPDNEVVLCKLLGLGRDVRTFRKHRAGALRGFVRCSDGRLYHPVVAEQVRRAWEKKVEQRWRTELARLKKHNQRHPDCQLPYPTLEQFAAGRGPYCPADADAVSLGTGGECPSGQPLQGTGTGTETETEIPPIDDGAGADAAKRSQADREGLSGRLKRVAEAAGMALDPSRRRWADELERLRGWEADGFDLERDILPAVTAKLAGLPPTETVGSLRFFEPELRTARARAKATDARPDLSPTVAMSVEDKVAALERSAATLERIGRQEEADEQRAQAARLRGSAHLDAGADAA